MIVDPSSLSYIQNVLQTAELAKINTVIIEPNRVRAIDDKHSVVMHQDQNVPDMEFGSIGINRISVFTQRVNVAKSMNEFALEATVEQGGADGPFARALTMKGKGIKVDYRCANPATMKAPKVINDTDEYHITMTPELVTLLQKGQVAMGSDEAVLVGDEGGVSLEISDINSDTLRYQFANDIKVIKNSETPPSFEYRYPIKLMYDLFNANKDGEFTLTSKGMVKINVNGLTLYMLKRE